MRFYKSDDLTPLKLPASEENIINTYGSANGDKIGLPNSSALFYQKEIAWFRTVRKSSKTLNF